MPPRNIPTPPLAQDAPPLSRPDSTWAGWGQWLALVTMTLDHLVRYAIPDSWGLGWIDASLGRIAFPLFAAMVAWHGLFNTRDPLRYARRIMVIGLVAQLPYQLMPREALLQFNICFTLALGLVGAAWLQRRMLQRTAGTPAWRLAGESAIVLLAWYVAGFWVEYGHLGLLLIPFFLLAIDQLYRAGETLADRLMAVVACLPLLAVAGLMNSSDMAKSFTVATSLAVLLLAAGAHQAIPRVPLAMPRRLWLAWYPGHFAAIAVLLIALGQADFP